MTGESSRVPRIMGGIVHHVDVRKADTPNQKPAE
jgi:hypothetical protein